MNNDTGFGLAQVKREGTTANYLTGKKGAHTKLQGETRWIELCYDPKEDVSHIDLDPIRQTLQDQIAMNKYSEDDVYLMIKSIANEFLDKSTT